MAEPAFDIAPRMPHVRPVSIERHLLGAQGYAELGMIEEALRELDRLGPAEGSGPDALRTRIEVLMRARAWQAALETGERLRHSNPDCPAAWLHCAFCLHELGRTDEAKETLLGGPSGLRGDATFHYNLACYDAVLGHPDQALEHLHRSFDMDRKFRRIALVDPDLASIRDAI